MSRKDNVLDRSMYGIYAAQYYSYLTTSLLQYGDQYNSGADASRRMFLCVKLWPVSDMVLVPERHGVRTGVSQRSSSPFCCSSIDGVRYNTFREELAIKYPAYGHAL